MLNIINEEDTRKVLVGIARMYVILSSMLLSALKLCSLYPALNALNDVVVRKHTKEWKNIIHLKKREYMPLGYWILLSDLVEMYQ